MVKIHGMDKVLRNINQAVGQINQAGAEGLIKAGTLVVREGKIETPVETGNLVNSWFGPVIQSTLKGFTAIIGLTASYAVYVHEMVGANFTGPRPTSKSPARREGGKPTAKAKFLEDPLKRNANIIIQLIRDSMARRLK